MLHLLNHTLAKSVDVLARRASPPPVPDGRDRARVRSRSGPCPGPGGLFAAGALALVGLPPFGLFISEFALLRAGFAAGGRWLMGLVLALLTAGPRSSGSSGHREPDALRRRPPAWPRGARTAGGSSRSPCAWRRWSPSGSRCRRRWRASSAQIVGDRGAMTDLRTPARARGRSISARDRRVRLHGAAGSSRCTARPGTCRRWRAGSAAGFGADLILMVAADRRRSAGVRGPLPLRAQAGELVRPRHRRRARRSARRSPRWPRSTTRPRGSSGRSTTSSASWPRGIPIPGRSCATRSGRTTTSRCGRTRCRAIPRRRAGLSRSPRWAVRACTRSRWGRCTPA